MKVAALFDWDGVVIDSSEKHERSWELLAAESGRVLPPDHFLRGFGRKNQIIIPEILAWTRDPGEIEKLSQRKEELYRELVRRDGVTVLPGARTLLEALKEAGIPRAIGSSTPRANLEAIFAVTGLDALFDGVVSAEDVVHGKPAPDVFLQGARLLGVEPNRCVVFEDALFGIEAGHRAGMKVIAVATTHPIEELGDADRAVRSLEEVRPGDLRHLVAAGPSAN